LESEESNLIEFYKNERTLDPRYVPDALQCRDDEIEKLSRIIVRRVNNNIVPKHIMLVGPKRSGKTVCVKHVLGEVKNNKDVLCSYLVADTSIYQILKTIASNFGIETSNRLINTNEYWTKIEERVAKEEFNGFMTRLSRTGFYQPDVQGFFSSEKGTLRQISTALSLRWAR
jgi:Cdc6-like AAA superfamily ATPase